MDYIHVGTKKIEDKCVCKLLLQQMIMCIYYLKDYKDVFNKGTKHTHFHNKKNAVHSKNVDQSFTNRKNANILHSSNIWSWIKNQTMAKITSTHASLQALIDKLEVYIMLGKYENWKLIKVIQIEHCLCFNSTEVPRRDCRGKDFQIDHCLCFGITEAPRRGCRGKGV